MITKAKVNLVSVKSFHQAAMEVKDLSPEFDKGISCIEQIHKSLIESENNVEEKINEMQAAKEKLSVKMRRIEEDIARLTSQINELQGKISSSVSELSTINSTDTITDVNGEKHGFINPAYIALETEISAIKSEVSAIEAEMYQYKQRLDRAHTLDGQLSSQIDNANSTVYSLDEKASTCKQLMDQLGDIKKSNYNKSIIAVENLKKIEQIVASYMRIKMTYEAGINLTETDSTSSKTGINVNIKINKTTVVSEQKDERIKISQEDIKRHQIKFDTNNHICEYEGRKYGVKYNTYKYCIDHTPKENPILGHYEGTRGESKYLPSNRSAEGIVVIGILKQYGLNGIEYRNGEPDFEVCAEAIVKIKGMTVNRYNYTDENGLTKLGNFSQADVELAKLWNYEEKGRRSNWTAREVLDYRQANGLTWHEKCDTETMVLVKSEINAYFKHVGGCSECRLRDASEDEGGFDE